MRKKVLKNRKILSIYILNQFTQNHFFSKKSNEKTFKFFLQNLKISILIIKVIYIRNFNKIYHYTI